MLKAQHTWRTVDSIHLSSATGEQWIQSIPVARIEQAVSKLRR